MSKSRELLYITEKADWKEILTRYGFTYDSGEDIWNNYNISVRIDPYLRAIFYDQNMMINSASSESAAEKILAKLFGNKKSGPTETGIDNLLSHINKIPGVTKSKKTTPTNAIFVIDGIEYRLSKRE